MNCTLRYLTIGKDKVFMKKGETFDISKSHFSDEKKLSILEKDISSFLSENNSLKLRANGSGPAVYNLRTTRNSRGYLAKRME